MTASRKPAARWAHISRCTAYDAPPTKIIQAEMHGERRWVALLPVAIPPAVAALLDEERPLTVGELPRIPLGLGRAVRPTTKVALLRAHGCPLLTLHDVDAEPLLALVALFDGDRAVILADEYAQQDSFVEVREVVEVPRAKLAAAIFGGVR